MNMQKKLLCLSLAVLLAVPVLTMTALDAAALPTNGSAAAAYNGGTGQHDNGQLGNGQHDNGQHGNGYNPVMDQAGFDQNSRSFHMQVDNRGGSNEYVGMRVYYYKHVNYGQGYELIGQDSCWMQAYPGHSYQLSCGHVPYGTTWVVYGAPWYADGNHHGWTGANGPYGDTNEHWNVYTVR